MIGGQGEDFCGKSETGSPPAESEVLHGNEQRCHKRNPHELIYPVCSSIDEWSYVSAAFFSKRK
ncbi:hypothetical protein ABEY63_19430 [Priestia aryabhattai]|uniref:hypothetical protein n=1 Tax=Priestia TaxID=2800373 RepID=UPI00164A0C4A|nr:MULTISPECIES: hypothetical protein [Priestia]MCM2974817.1 hypothetical protein [Priestia aryabhattai]MCQ9282767.1 hypothetical protein [Priestia aryabhattai]MEB4871268.1 hypothetical protein [Priestia megaterium]MED3989177.1 hypothetical protein [Priestia aryabhattai]